MVCRVKVRLKVKDGVFEGRALLNSGFEAVTEVAISLNICEYLLILGVVRWMSGRRLPYPRAPWRGLCWGLL